MISESDYELDHEFDADCDCDKCIRLQEQKSMDDEIDKEINRRMSKEDLD